VLESDLDDGPPQVEFDNPAEGWRRARSQQVVLQLAKGLDLVANVAERLVAVEAQHPSHLSGRMIVIDMFRVRLSTARAPPALGSQHLVDVDLTNAVSAPQVDLPRAPIVLDRVFSGLVVVARLAVAATTRLRPATSRKVIVRLVSRTTRTPSKARWRDATGTHRPSNLCAPLSIRVAAALTETEFAVAGVTIGRGSVEPELLKRLLDLAVRAGLHSSIIETTTDTFRRERGS
jgi:hypothetical protein